MKLAKTPQEAKTIAASLLGKTVVTHQTGGRGAISPGAFDQGPAGMGVASLGDATLTAPLAWGVFCWG